MGCKESSGTATATSSGVAVDNWIAQYMQMNAQLLQSALSSYAPVMKAWTSWYQSAVPPQSQNLSQTPATAAKPGQKATHGCCDIPETCCPPRCACTLSWDASPGETRKATIKIRNTSKDAVDYQLVPKAFEACGKSIDATPDVTPSELRAAAGETVTATVSVEVGDQFHPGATYHAEILVRGKYERSVCLELNLCCDEDSVCRFDLGDIPYRKRADDWFRHFQCSEPCFAPVSQPNAPPVGTAPPTNAPAPPTAVSNPPTSVENPLK